jgi:hypothetical protein
MKSEDKQSLKKVEKEIRDHRKENKNPCRGKQMLVPVV